MVALGYSGWAQAMMSTAITPEQVRATANAGFVPVATLAEADDADIDLVQPTALNVGSTTATLPVPRLEVVDRARLLKAALRARRAFPGPVGSLIASELTTWSELSFRFGGNSTIAKLVDAIEATHIPEPEPAVAA